MSDKSIWEKLTEFCPCCGKKLDFPKEPATCRFCGWEEWSTKDQESNELDST